jgi:hypothetical protein
MKLLNISPVTQIIETTPAPQTIEEIIKAKSAVMTDTEKAAYASEIDQIVFNQLLKVDITLVEISVTEWWKAVHAKYPDVVFAGKYGDDDVYYTCTKKEFEKVIALDWTNLRQYITNRRDCEDFGRILVARLIDYYGLSSVHLVKGETTSGAHGWAMVVLKTEAGWEAFQEEPQTDQVFDLNANLGIYTPIEVNGRVK